MYLQKDCVEQVTLELKFRVCRYHKRSCLLDKFLLQIIFLSLICFVLLSTIRNKRKYVCFKFQRSSTMNSAYNLKIIEMPVNICLFIS